MFYSLSYRKFQRFSGEATDLRSRRRRELNGGQLGCRFLGSFYEFLNQDFGSQPVHGREGIQVHVDVSGVLGFQSETFLNQHLSCAREGN